jgi:menaquinone-dependent protoporphyrinogen oxidase
MKASNKKRVLVVFASSFGQTRKIAEGLALALRGRGCIVELGDAGQGVSGLPPPADYDAVVLGSRVQYGKHAPAIAAYVHAHRAALFDVVSAFFSVSMSASRRELGSDPNGYVKKQLEELAWEPRLTAAFGGALPYTKYGFILRFVMKQISKRAGHTTDTSRDHEFTDWDAVSRFANAIADELIVRAEPPRATMPA